MLDRRASRRRIEHGSPHKGQKRVLRGGSWNNNGRNLRSAQRNANHPDRRNRNIGLRLAGALPIIRTGGSVNQRMDRFRRAYPGGPIPGPWRVSRYPAAADTESLPPGRFCRVMNDHVA